MKSNQLDAKYPNIPQGLPYKCECCGVPGYPARPNLGASEWICDCACHFSNQLDPRQIMGTAEFRANYECWLDDLEEAVK